MRFRSDRANNRLILQLALITIISFTAVSLPSLLANSNLQQISNDSVTIFLNGDAVGSIPGWNNSSPGPTITVNSGTTVHLLLNATDILLHSWFIDTQKNYAPDPNGISSPDFSAFTTHILNFTFTPVIGQNIPVAGNWTYRCKYHPFPYMYGTIRILPPRTTPDFTLTTSSPNITTTANTTTTTTVMVRPLASFTGTVNLSSLALNGIATTIDPQSISNGSGNATLTLTAAISGNFTVEITATSGPLVHSLNITIQATDFTISANPTTTTTRINSPTITMITVGSVNQFEGTVTLETNSTLCTLSQDTITGHANTTLSCTFSTRGTFNIQVTGTAGSLSHTVTIVYNVIQHGHKNHLHEQNV